MNKKTLITIILFITACFVFAKFNSFFSNKKAIQPIQELPIESNLDFIDSNTWQAIETDPTSGMLKTDSLKWLEKEEQELWQELGKIGIGKNVYKRYEKKYRQEYAQLNKVGRPDAPKISQATINLIRPVLEQFDIDPDKVSICHLALPIPIATNDEAMLINETIFNAMSHKGKLFTIAHEAQHIKFKDDSHLYVLEELIKYQCTDKDKAKHLMCRVQRFLEARADYYAAIKDPIFAEGLVESTTRMLYVQGENSIATHPMKRTRIALGQKILHNVKV